jgi:AbrB family looped-hinge helix DNA binding protein
MPTSTITSRGRITIPKAVRDCLRLVAGNRVEFLMREDGTVVMVPRTVRVADLEGILSAPEAPVSVTDMNQAIRSPVKPS